MIYLQRPVLKEDDIIQAYPGVLVEGSFPTLENGAFMCKGPLCSFCTNEPLEKIHPGSTTSTNPQTTPAEEEGQAVKRFMDPWLKAFASSGTGASFPLLCLRMDRNISVGVW